MATATATTTVSSDCRFGADRWGSWVGFGVVERAKPRVLHYEWVHKRWRVVPSNPGVRRQTEFTVWRRNESIERKQEPFVRLYEGTVAGF